MKNFAKLAAAAALASAAFAVTSAPSAAAPICLESYRIENTTIGKDARTIDFHMRDGTVWRNTLRNKCQDLHWYGFVYEVNGPDEVCENLQAIRVLHTGETCLLGKFTKV